MADKKTINMVEVAPATHELLIQIANSEGLPIKDAVGKILNTFAYEYQSNQDNFSKYTKVYLHLTEFEKQRQARENVKRAAAIYLDDPTEENAERLYKMSELADLEPTELLGNLQFDPFMSIIAEARGSKEFVSCVQWLANKMIENRKDGIPSTVVFVTGKSLGYSDYMIRQAKNYINEQEKKYIIASERVKNGWYWRLQDNPAYNPALEDQPIDIQNSTIFK